MIATVPSATLLGVDGKPVRVEVHVGNGLPNFTVVGLPDAACRESRDRIRAAFASSELKFPQQRVTVNLAPSGVRKGGAGLDLPIAVGLLVAADQLGASAIARTGFVGELGLDGSVRRVPGLLAQVDAIRERSVVVAREGAVEAGLVGRHVVRGVRSLSELLAALKGAIEWPDLPVATSDPPPPGPDLGDVRGQRMGRWALEVAAAGGHHVLMIGPPGAGKTMLARRLAGLLPPLTRTEAIETTRVHSAAGVALPASGLIQQAPFRAPHHSSSMVSIVGGGTSALRPGEVSLAHNGVLFLDEMGEFPTAVLDALRQPVEEAVVRLSRARSTVSFPARFLLVAAMNPCPCGEGGPPGSCRCSDADRSRYARRLSGPLLDRFDLRVPMSRPDIAQLLGSEAPERSAPVADRVARARQMAAARGVRCNALLTADELERFARLTAPAQRILEYRLREGALSARGLHRVHRLARTLADLAGHDGALDETHVCGALELRAERSVLQVAS